MPPLREREAKVLLSTSCKSSLARGKAANPYPPLRPSRCTATATPAPKNVPAIKSLTQ